MYKNVDVHRHRSGNSKLKGHILTDILEGINLFSMYDVILNNLALGHQASNH